MKKKKIIGILTITFVLVGSVFIGGTLAFLVKQTNREANGFTFGNADIELTEEQWQKLTDEERTVYPGKRVTKDPKVTNTGETDIYVYLEVKIPRADVRTVSAGVDGAEKIDDPQVRNLFSYTPAGDWIEIENTTDDEWNTIIYGYDKILKPGEETTALFDSVEYLNIVEGELKKDTRLNMPINAYAIQTGYLNESGSTNIEKMKDAFSKYNAEAERR